LAVVGECPLGIDKSVDVRHGGCMTNPLDLERFVEAQEPVFAVALAELHAGRKRSHWMWFVFPQLRELGRSATAVHFGIASRDEAVAYQQHEVLGPRLRTCARALTTLGDTTAQRVMGDVDAMKLRSSMTLFAHADPPESRFARVLDRYFAGAEDAETVRRI
jgi:uncharacterized protein (DUF1810 family)